MPNDPTLALANQAAEIERLKERVEKLEAFCFNYSGNSVTVRDLITLSHLEGSEQTQD